MCDRRCALSISGCAQRRAPSPATNSRSPIEPTDAPVPERTLAERAIPPADTLSRAMFVQMARDCGAALFARQSDATLTRRDHWGTLALVEVPALLVWGAADTFVPIEVGRRIAGILPDARYEVLPGCGHFPSMERPEATTAIARDWLLDRFRGRN
ncbi:alpha/beta fold hydrolase [Cupriavidus sp. UME77]|uniref:alpha/beta fold hydrolase n=1 Tax=Cupriavidus sp. UME77 TaxID=1862321 RepID=UPI00351CA3FD